MPEDASYRDNDRSSLAEARERLYTPGAVPEPEARGTYETEHAGILHAWEHPVALLKNAHPARRLRLASLFFAGAFLFFLVALAASGYLLYFGGNSVSINNVDLQIAGPTSIAGGDTVPLSLAITNRNAVPLQNAALEIDFPSGTRSADDPLSPYPRYMENLGTIAPGVTVTRSVRAVVFGGEGEQVSLAASLSFDAVGSSATFVKKVPYPITVSSAPLSLSIDAPAEAVSGQPFAFDVSIRSNASAPLQNIVVASSFPFGFTLASSSVPVAGSSFILGTLAPGEHRTISLSGSLAAEDGSTRAFTFTVGMAASAAASTLSIPYLSQSATLTVAAPFIRTALSINGDSSGAAIVAPGSSVAVALRYLNTLASAVTNARVTVALSGDAIDYASVQTSDGFYQSSTRSIVFSRDTEPALAALAPDASGTGSFTFRTLPAGAGAHSPLVTLTVSVMGTREGQSGVPQAVSASSETSLKVLGAPSLSVVAMHASGPFSNSGPLPPSPGAPTTYTVSWRTGASGTALAGTTVVATLPAYVTYTGKTAGAGSFSYDPNSRTVSWSAGDLAPGASATGFFQISFLPSLSQKATAPALTSPASLSAFDRYARADVATQAPAATTETPGDPGYSPSRATVQ